jgi:hypothetical protein
VFDYFAQGALPGSRIIFTYVHVGVLDGAFAARGLERLTAVLRACGEPWTFGFEPKEVPPSSPENLIPGDQRMRGQGKDVRGRRSSGMIPEQHRLLGCDYSEFTKFIPV